MERQSLVMMQPLAWKKKRFVQSYKSRARDLDLEHILDARSSGDRRVQVWSQSSHLCRIVEEICAKGLRTDRRTDGRTDRRRTPRHCISSWNELIKVRQESRAIAGRTVQTDSQTDIDGRLIVTEPRSRSIVR